MNSPFSGIYLRLISKRYHESAMISIKKNLVNTCTLYSMINKKADKTQNNEEQEKKTQ